MIEYLLIQLELGGHTPSLVTAYVPQVMEVCI